MNNWTGTIPDNWPANAACQGMGRRSEIFFASDKNRPLITEARSICTGCPSRIACLTTAFQEGDVYGMRGGLTRKQRLYYLRKNNHDTGRAIADATGDVTAIIRRIYHLHAQPAADGHVVWTDHRKLISVREEPYTVHRIAWWAHYGRAPVGSVTRACAVEGCVAKACLADRRMREQTAREKAAV